MDLLDFLNSKDKVIVVKDEYFNPQANPNPYIFPPIMQTISHTITSSDLAEANPVISLTLPNVPLTINNISIDYDSITASNYMYKVDIRPANPIQNNAYSVFPSGTSYAPIDKSSTGTIDVLPSSIIQLKAYNYTSTTLDGNITMYVSAVIKRF